MLCASGSSSRLSAGSRESPSCPSRRARAHHGKLQVPPGGATTPLLFPGSCTRRGDGAALVTSVPWGWQGWSCSPGSASWRFSWQSWSFQRRSCPLHWGSAGKNGVQAPQVVEQSAERACAHMDPSSNDVFNPFFPIPVSLGCGVSLSGVQPGCSSTNISSFLSSWVPVGFSS